MAGYTRNDTNNNIATGNVIRAADLDGEFDAVQSAFNGTTGHSHDGTAGEGGPITKLGPAQNVTVTSQSILPAISGDMSLGTTGLRYENGYFTGNVVATGGFVGDVTGDLTGNADTATALETARTISLNGDVSGSVSFDGTANVSITATVADDSHNHVISNVDGLQSALNLKAPLNSPALTGTPTVPTRSQGDNSTKIASTAYVDTAVSGIVDSAPTALNTLNELAAALGDDANFSTTITNSIGTKAPLNNPDFTGTPKSVNPPSNSDSRQIATTSFVREVLETIYPIGSVYINANSTTNPATLIGFGTWVAFGAGRVLVGQNINDSSFNQMGETGGSKNATLPSHSHSFSGNNRSSSAGAHGHTVSDPGHRHRMVGPNGPFNNNFNPQSGTGSYGGGTPDDGSNRYDTYIATTGVTVANVGNHSHTVYISGTTDSKGSSASNANLQPYVVVKMWRRTA